LRVVTRLSCGGYMVNALFYQEPIMVLLRTAAVVLSVMRLVALPTCLVYGVWELCALQRARWLGRKFRY
jgi:hypothetical protein